MSSDVGIPISEYALTAPYPSDPSIFFCVRSNGSVKSVPTPGSDCYDRTKW
jgi:hypothetical protein